MVVFVGQGSSRNQISWLHISHVILTLCCLPASQIICMLNFPPVMLVSSFTLFVSQILLGSTPCSPFQIWAPMKKFQTLVSYPLGKKRSAAVPNKREFLFPGFQQNFQMDVFQVLAAILHLGNVQVTALSSERSSVHVRLRCMSASSLKASVFEGPAKEHLCGSLALTLEERPENQFSRNKDFHWLPP